ncbi:MAG: hypothetical protein QOD77_845 [Thermoplasmata archaeon]|nr:hypothetical protein [Thermoplasmata archaeon]
MSRVGVVVAGLALAVGLLWPAAPAADPDRSAGPDADAADAGPLHARAAELLAFCRPQPDLQGCVLQEAERVLAVRGSPEAFRLLAETTQADASLRPQDHQLAHDLGRASIDHYPNTTAALAVCPFNMASGCFHGVLEAHFGRQGPPAAAADVAGLCTPDGGWNRQFQCLHGLGHGLTMVAGHDLPQALAWCDLLGDGGHQDSCHGGAFMENIMGETMVADHHHHGNASTWVRLKPDDLSYPCDVVEPRHQRTCWFLQSSAVLQQGFGLTEAFATCDGAPEEYVRLCYQSMGRDISGRTLRDGPQILQQCGQGSEPYVPDCIYGAAQEMVNYAGDVAPGFAFCPTTPTASRATCWRAVGAMLSVLETDDGARRAWCAQAAANEADCLSGAGLA